MFFLFPQVSRNWRCESELPLKPSSLTCYKHSLCSCDRALWAKHEERLPTRCNNIDDLLSIPDVIIDYCLDMFRASLCPSSGEKTTCYCIWGLLLVVLDVAGCGSVVLCCRVWALWRLLLCCRSYSPSAGQVARKNLPMFGASASFKKTENWITTFRKFLSFFTYFIIVQNFCMWQLSILFAGYFFVKWVVLY